MSNTFGNYAIIVYGGTFSGVAAAENAAKLLPDESILLINPSPGWGGVSGVGGQNAWDTRNWQHGDRSMTPQGGSFRQWYRTSGQAYDPEAIQDQLRESVAGRENVDVLDFWDAVDVVASDDGRGLSGVQVTPLKRVEGETKPSGQQVIVEGRQFVDASESGRLARLAGVPLSVGRTDWANDSRQMAATLMFQMTDVDWRTISQARSPNGQQTYGQATAPSSDRRLFWGGHWYVKNAAAIQEFNDSFPRFRIKALNAAESGDGRFWFNALLIYDVDGRYDARERGKILPATPDHSPWDVDRARERANEVVATDAFETAMRAFPGLERASFVPDDRGEPTTADALYLRETVHARGDDGFAITRDDVVDAGTGPNDGADADYYDTRIGLAYYWLNNNGYVSSTPSDAAEFYATENPVYVPFEALTTSHCDNLLVSGYAASVSSEAWFEMRLTPNLCVLGDGAGVGAAVASEHGVDPIDFGDEEIEELQTILADEVGAILEKDPDAGTVV
ncbi:MAG TPA: FAD-dependent oxidoreductase [Natronoarchaeum rubrum]|nr:FAD-dependent oxidoreductase [Natronoarchaeum rubrum]